jgi:hypothetical protein
MAETEAIIYLDETEPDAQLHRLHVQLPGYVLELELLTTVAEAKAIADFLRNSLLAFQHESLIQQPPTSPPLHDYFEGGILE